MDAYVDRRVDHLVNCLIWSVIFGLVLALSQCSGG